MFLETNRCAERNVKTNIDSMDYHRAVRLDCVLVTSEYIFVLEAYMYCAF